MDSRSRKLLRIHRTTEWLAALLGLAVGRIVLLQGVLFVSTMGGLSKIYTVPKVRVTVDTGTFHAETDSRYFAYR
jgi:hypothetical protein